MKARLIALALLIGAPVIVAPVAQADPPAACADAQGPIHQGDPRYDPELDADHDGIACESSRPHAVAPMSSPASASIPVSSPPAAATLPTTGMDVGPGLVAGSAALAAGIALVARSRRAILKA